jgi:hypothetical protein
MSEIVYTGPTATGTTINPTNTFLPYRTNATTFADSCLKQTSATQLQSIFGGNNNGININTSSGTYQFGILTGITNYLSLGTGGVAAIYQGSVNGFNINHLATNYSFGRLTGGNLTSFFISDSGRTISFKSAGIDEGFSANFITRQFYFGQINSSNRTLLFISDTSQTILTNNNGLVNGLRFDFGGLRTYLFGQITGSNRTQLLIDDANQTISTSRNGSKTGISIDTNIVTIGSLTLGNQLGLGTNDSSASFVFNGTNITSAGAGGNAGHLKILINGTPYRIAYQNP